MDLTKAAAYSAKHPTIFGRRRKRFPSTAAIASKT